MYVHLSIKVYLHCIPVYIYFTISKCVNYNKKDK